ncbi:replication protein RepA [Enterococcus faecalis]|mgnify:CR=1 FL=1|uniref:Replication initiator protein A n=4 Tax=Enterococcus faecalis TaxID=1351 RepID=A0A6B1XP09_ENTFL|nr:replication initiator protein A [Enterococcus faecalis]EAE3637249.1 replication initiator protein A [Listeria monocytogenes]EGO2582623.1 replication initiator protein A [Enterococcus faecalis]EGO2585367.1 replication initiator protein A [Enterococcus faecalis]EGO2590829.1 replication initiator protein A [Enterococcus faecalis]EGO2699327.1 replication initiator protein A [Enterococcus faecalis]
MNDFQFYKSKEIYREKYYQMPKVFFTNELYKSLSNDAKIAYMLLKDRFDSSVKNNWVDNEDNIYFIYTVAELMTLLNCREGKVSKIKKELEAVNLLKQKKGRVKKINGKIETTPNLLYLGKPIVTSEDVFKINEEQNNVNPVIAKIANTEKVNDINENPVIAKIANTEKVNNIKDNSVIAKIADNLFYTSYLDTLDTLDTKKEELQQQLLLDQFPEVQENTFLNKDSLKIIAAFSNTIQEAHEKVGTIIRAKTKAEKDYNVVLIGEDYQEEIDKCLRRVMHKIKTDATVTSPKGLFYKSFYNLFVECTIEKKNLLNQNKIENRPQIATHNWVEKQ